MLWLLEMPPPIYYTKLKWHRQSPRRFVKTFPQRSDPLTIEVSLAILLLKGKRQSSICRPYENPSSRRSLHSSLVRIYQRGRLRSSILSSFQYLVRAPHRFRPQNNHRRKSHRSASRRGVTCLWSSQSRLLDPRPQTPTILTCSSGHQGSLNVTPFPYRQIRSFLIIPVGLLPPAEDLQ